MGQTPGPPAPSGPHPPIVSQLHRTGILLARLWLPGAHPPHRGARAAPADPGQPFRLHARDPRGGEKPPGAVYSGRGEGMLWLNPDSLGQLPICGGNKMILKKIVLALLIIGGLNWGLVGLFRFDCVGWLLGGTASILSRVIFSVVGLAAVVAVPMLFERENPGPTEGADSH